MKQLLFICTFLLFGINCLAEEITVKFYRSYLKDREIDRRSITLEPTAAIDGNTVRIYTNVAITGLHTSIKDSMGNIVYTYDDMATSRSHMFEVYDLPEGDYILEVEIGEDSYYGTFVIK